MAGLSEKDWKLFRNNLPEWQERYMGKLVEEYKEILNSDKLPSDKYWALEGRVKSDKRNPGVVITDISRTNFYDHLVSLLRYKVITMEDLKDFSDDTKDIIKRLIG